MFVWCNGYTIINKSINNKFDFLAREAAKTDIDHMVAMLIGSQSDNIVK